MTRLMSEASVREWRDHPVSIQFKTVLLHRLDRVAAELFSGRPVDPIRQGQGVAYRQLLHLLDLPPDQLMEALQKEYKA